MGVASARELTVLVGAQEGAETEAVAGLREDLAVAVAVAQGPGVSYLADP